MSEIPDDVMKAADTAWLELASLNEGVVPLRVAETAVIARAILSERERATKAENERCARIADELAGIGTPGMPLLGAGMAQAAKSIASAIRSGSPS